MYNDRSLFSELWFPFLIPLFSFLYILEMQFYSPDSKHETTIRAGLLNTVSWSSQNDCFWPCSFRTINFPPFTKPVGKNVTFLAASIVASQFPPSLRPKEHQCICARSLKFPVVLLFPIGVENEINMVFFRCTRYIAAWNTCGLACDPHPSYCNSTTNKTTIPNCYSGIIVDTIDIHRPYLPRSWPYSTLASRHLHVNNPSVQITHTAFQYTSATDQNMEHLYCHTERKHLRHFPDVGFKNCLEKKFVHIPWRTDKDAIIRSRDHHHHHCHPS